MKKIITSHYYDRSHAEKEKQQIFLNSWLFIALSGRLPQANTMVVEELMGYSILLVRDQESIVHAYQNACVHRGTQIARKKKRWKGKTTHELSCPYHGWKYDLKGRLCHVPKKEDLCHTPCPNLQEFAVVESFGLIWICLGTPKETATEFLRQLRERLTKYQLQEMQPIENRDFSFPVNWKISLENSLDFYHVGTVHPTTVGSQVRQAPTFARLNRHCLQSLHIAPYSWRDKLDRHCARSDVYSQQELASLHKYFVFPNLVLNVLPYHLTIMQFWPIDARNCVMRYRFCMRKEPGIIERTRSYASWIASRIILYEDVKLYPQIQKGMEQAVIDQQPLHKEEIAIHHFHEALNQWVNDAR